MHRSDKEHIDAIIIGAQKAATTSLKEYFRQHPEIISHSTKEFAYFADNDEFHRGFHPSFHLYFKYKESGKITLAKNVSIYNNPTAIERLHQHNPNAKLIFVLREPVERAYSSYNMAVADGWINIPFENIVDDLVSGKLDKESIFYRNFFSLGCYTESFKYITKHFPLTQVKVVLFEEVKEKPLEICQDIFKFIDVDSSFNPEVNKKYNITRKSRFLFYSQILNKLQRKNNLFKKFSKTYLPYPIFLKLSYFFKEINMKKEHYGEMKQDTKNKLMDFYKKQNIGLADFLGNKKIDWPSLNT